MLPAPEVHDDAPPKFRAGGGADDLTLIKGIGPVYRDRLGAADIHSFSDLASVSAAEVSGIAQTSAAVAQAWVESARSRT